MIYRNYLQMVVFGDVLEQQNLFQSFVNLRGYWVNAKKKKISKNNTKNVRKGITSDTWKTIVNEYPINKDLKDIFNSEPDHEVFMSMLIEEYKNYKENGKKNLGCY